MESPGKSALVAIAHIQRDMRQGAIRLLQYRSRFLQSPAHDVVFRRLTELLAKQGMEMTDAQSGELGDLTNRDILVAMGLDKAKRRRQTVRQRIILYTQSLLQSGQKQIPGNYSLNTLQPSIPDF